MANAKDIFVAVSACLPPSEFWAQFGAVDLHPAEEAAIDKARLICLDIAAEGRSDTVVVFAQVPRGEEGSRTVVTHSSEATAELAYLALKIGAVTLEELVDKFLEEAGEMGEPVEVTDGVYYSSSKSAKD